MKVISNTEYINTIYDCWTDVAVLKKLSLPIAIHNVKEEEIYLMAVLNTNFQDKHVQQWIKTLHREIHYRLSRVHRNKL